MLVWTSTYNLPTPPQISCTREMTYPLGSAEPPLCAFMRPPFPKRLKSGLGHSLAPGQVFLVIPAEGESILDRVNGFYNSPATVSRMAQMLLEGVVVLGPAI